MSKQVLINESPEGATFEGPVYVVSSKTGVGKTGKEYLSAIVADKSGEYDLKAWDNFGKFLPLFMKGNFLTLKAKVGSFQGKKQLTFLSVEKIEQNNIPWEVFRDEIPADQDQCWKELQNILNTISTPFWKQFLVELWKEPDLERRFKIYPAAKSIHHSGPCGLLKHCLSILQTLSFFADHFSRYHLNRDLLLLGGLLHDIGKCYELSFDFRTEYTLEGQLIGHISIGSELVERIAERAKVPNHDKILLKHIVLSHHGSLEFGSPKVPMTLEAFLVHYVDLLDSKMETFSDHMRDQGTNEEGWTSFNRFLDRVLYVPKENQNIFTKRNGNSSESKLGDVLKRAFDDLNNDKK